MNFASHHLYKHINKLLIILSYTVNNFGPLIRDKNCMYEEVEREDDLNEEDFDNILKEFEQEFDQDINPNPNLNPNPNPFVESDD